MTATKDSGSTDNNNNKEQFDDQSTKEFKINQQLLQLILGEDVTSFKITLGSAPGDNYMSIMHAVEVHIRGRPEPCHIVIKCYPNQAGRREFLDQVGIFGTEFFFYNDWVPKLEKVAGDHPELCKLCLPEFLGGNRAAVGGGPAVGRNRAGPFAYPEPWTKENFIAMADLRRERGFKMANRMAANGLDVDHAILVVKQLGTLHALSWVFKVGQGLKNFHTVYPDMVDTTFCSETMASFRPLLTTVNNSALAQVEQEFGTDHPIYLGLKKFYSDNDAIATLQKFLTHEGTAERELESFLRIRDERQTNFEEEPWLVSIHGDCWVNNLMFDYGAEAENPKPKEVVMFDFQMCHEACPTADLAYFLLSSTTTKTRKESENDILRAYYDQFMLICDTLDCKPLPGFSWATLQRKFRRAKVYGFVMGLILLNVMLKPPEEAVELDSLSGDMNDVFGTVMAGGDRNMALKTRILELVKEFYEQGII